MNLLASITGSITDWRSGETWDASRIASDAGAVAARLRAEGVGPGDRVLITHGGTPAFFADLFGVWQAGACVVCLNPATTAAEMEIIRDFIRPIATLTGETMEAALETAGAGEGSGGLEDDALILFTSGTTGTPKGVVHGFRSLLARVALNRAHMPAGVLAKTLCVLPTHFGHGLIGNCLTALLGGNDLVLAPGTNMEVPTTLGRIIDEHGITFMSSVPTLWRKVTRQAERPREGTLSRVHVGSAPLSAELWMKIADWAGTRDVVNMYGITETANWIGGASLAEFTPENGLVGRLWGGSAAILTEAGDLFSNGEGEILVQAPSLMRGYDGRPEATREVLRDGWFHTGDIGTIDRSGIIRLTGRARFAINRGGLKVYPEDIDLLLERHEAVREACAFAIADEVEGETIGVAVALNKGADIDVFALKRWCAEHISREKVPVRWVILDEIPKTDRGKVNRSDVARHCIQLDPAA